jgi:hypothetical protein
MPSRFGWAATASLIVVLNGFGALPALAQATRTWVSGVGDDANPCSRIAPCKTFAGAISKTAAGGEISVLDPGGFGAVTITKAITLNGEGTLASILGAGTNAINVSAGAADTVIIRNISINGDGSGISGINFQTGGKLHVENVSIFGFTAQGIAFSPLVTAALRVSNTTISNCLRGIYVNPASSGVATASINGVVLSGNSTGMRVEDGSTVAIRDSSLVGNSSYGIVASATSRLASVSLESTSASNNGSAGIYAGPLSVIRISNVHATGNAFGLQGAGGTITSFGNNHVLGNTTSDGVPTNMSGPI